VIPGSPQYTGFIEATRAALMQLGQDASKASQIAIGDAWAMLNRQAQMLSYQNAFWGLSMIIACLIPLPFIMRRPPRNRPAGEPVAGH
jgi:DHA2 family multidrug resistance protein